MTYHLGIDVGGTKTEALIADEGGQAVGYGFAGPGNWEVVGYDGLARAVHAATADALAMAGAPIEGVVTAGMGIGGFDWPCQYARHRDALKSLHLRNAPVIVNDAALGIPAGSEEGWGVCIESGTSCNCRGWTRNRAREGRAIGGHGRWSGEAAGGLDIVARAMRAVSFQWSRRGPATALSRAFLRACGAGSLDELVEWTYLGRFTLDQGLVAVVFDVARGGDPPAQEVMRWAGAQLGDMACGVIRQLELQSEAFDLVLIGSIYNGHPLIEQTLRETVLATAPYARIVRFELPPVIGGVLLGMQALGMDTASLRDRLLCTAREVMGIPGLSCRR